MAETIKSVLQAYDTDTGKAEVLRVFDYHIEAPNWHPDGKTLIYNSLGGIFSYNLAAGESTEIDIAPCRYANNDHVLSRDGKTLVISAGTEESYASRCWILPVSGGKPRLVTENAPSYLHGISPDGQTLAYCAERGGNYDVYTISSAGGVETRLTDAEGLDDGPEYSPDGKHIWFNSVRSGLMQVWRMNADGTEQTQMTFDDDKNTWFPHVSPDGERVVMISYYKGDVESGDHPPGKNIELRLMNYDGSGLKTIVKAFGGQGTINVNSWSPDSSRFAFVTYE